MPSPKQQKVILQNIEVIENKITEIQKELEKIPAKKQAILDKYLK